jgi:integrase
MADTQPNNRETAVPKVKGIKGFGSPYLRGKKWWIRYSHHGKDMRESAHSERLIDAERRLKERWKQIGRGRFIGPAEDRLTGKEMFDALEVDYRNNGRRSLKTLKARLIPLRAAFDLERTIDITEVRIERYKADRLSTHTRYKRAVAPATLNRELAALKRAFKIAVEQKRLSSAPVIKLLAEHNVRQGFVEKTTFERIVAHLTEPLDDVARFAYVTGWRTKEVLTLTWTDVSREGKRITLRREHSKNGEPRVLPLVGTLVQLIERRWRAGNIGGLTNRPGYRSTFFTATVVQSQISGRRGRRRVRRLVSREPIFTTFVGPLSATWTGRA